MVHRPVKITNTNTTDMFYTNTPPSITPLKDIHRLYLWLLGSCWQVGSLNLVYAVVVAAEVVEVTATLAAAALSTWSYTDLTPEKYHHKNELKATAVTRGMTSSHENQFAKWSSFNLAMRPRRYRSHTPRSAICHGHAKARPLIVFLISCGGAVPGTGRSAEGSIM